MDTTEIIRENLAYVILIGVGLGVVLGLLPLIFAVRKGKIKLGLLAMLSTIIAGVAAVLSIGIILPLIVMLVFLWLILRKGPVTQTTASTDASDSVSGR